jgi:hypothetical protein
MAAPDRYRPPGGEHGRAAVGSAHQSNGEKLNTPTRRAAQLRCRVPEIMLRSRQPVTIRFPVIAGRVELVVEPPEARSAFTILTAYRLGYRHAGTLH